MRRWLLSEGGGKRRVVGTRKLGRQDVRVHTGCPERVQLVSCVLYEWKNRRAMLHRLRLYYVEKKFESWVFQARHQLNLSLFESHLYLALIQRIALLILSMGSWILRLNDITTNHSSIGTAYIDDKRKCDFSYYNFFLQNICGQRTYIYARRGTPCIHTMLGQRRMKRWTKGGGFARDVKTRDARKDRLCFVNNDNSSSNAYKQQRRAAHGLNVLPEINGIREWDTRCNPFVPKSFVNTATIIPCRDS